MISKRRLEEVVTLVIRVVTRVSVLRFKTYGLVAICGVVTWSGYTAKIDWSGTGHAASRSAELRSAGADPFWVVLALLLGLLSLALANMIHLHVGKQAFRDALRDPSLSDELKKEIIDRM